VAHLPGVVVNRAFFQAEQTPGYVLENHLTIKGRLTKTALAED
jgi:hypothetical protein